MDHLTLSVLLAAWSSVLGQTRSSWTEEFNSGVSRPYVTEGGVWDFSTEYLQAHDVQGDGAELRFLFTDRIYSSSRENLTIDIDVSKDVWGSDSDKVGVIFAGDAEGRTFYELLINAPFQKFSINRIAPEFNETYSHGVNSNIVKEGMNHLQVRYDNQGWHFYINGSELDAEITAHLNTYLPAVEGKIGVCSFDSRTDNDPAYNGIARFDNFTVEYDALSAMEGTGATFVRGDANEDDQVDVSDPIKSLEDLFTPSSGDGAGAGLVSSYCLDRQDSNDDGEVDISDAIYTLLFLFNNGDGRFKMRPPYYGGKGIDTTVDPIYCPE